MLESPTSLQILLYHLNQHLRLGCLLCCTLFTMACQSLCQFHFTLLGGQFFILVIKNILLQLDCFLVQSTLFGCHIFIVADADVARCLCEKAQLLWTLLRSTVDFVNCLRVWSIIVGWCLVIWLSFDIDLIYQFHLSIVCLSDLSVSYLIINCITICLTLLLARLKNLEVNFF